MSTSKEEVPLNFHKENPEDVMSVFQVEDLIKEYNYRILANALLTPSGKYPLTLRPPRFQGEETSIRAMTKQEVEAMSIRERNENNWDLFSSILRDQISPTGIISNTPTLAASVTLVELINEIGLSGKIYYKQKGEKIYVILKGRASERFNLNGTRYLNTHPEIVRLGLAKVDVKAGLKAGFKGGLYVYGAVKAYEALEMVLEDKEIKPSFWENIPAEVTKLAISTVITAAVGTVVIAAGVPIAAGIGITLVVGFAVGIGLDYLDKKIGFTETVSHAADKLWKNLKNWWNSDSGIDKAAPSGCFIGDPLAGFAFYGGFGRNQRVVPCGRHFVYTA